MVGQFGCGIGLGVRKVPVFALSTKGSTAALGTVYALGLALTWAVTVHIFGSAIKSTGFSGATHIGWVIATIYIDGGSQGESTMVAGAQGYCVFTG